MEGKELKRCNCMVEHIIKLKNNELIIKRIN